MVKAMIVVFSTLAIGYVLLCIILYLFQERLIFFPQKLPKNHLFSFDVEFEEMSFKTKDGKLLNGLLFKAQNPKGLVFYLHGNANSLETWGNIAGLYTDLDHDIFIMDYRGYGKSEGKIESQAQMFEDNQLVYEKLKKNYDEKNITIIGNSIGTGMAAKLASENNAKQLILKAPFYNLTAIMHERFLLLPSFILKYKFNTPLFFKRCRMPVTIFHGDEDAVIKHDHSRRLKQEFGTRLQLITLKNYGHNGINENLQYRAEVAKILQQG